MPGALKDAEATSGTPSGEQLVRAGARVYHTLAILAADTSQVLIGFMIDICLLNVPVICWLSPGTSTETFQDTAQCTCNFPTIIQQDSSGQELNYLCILKTEFSPLRFPHPHTVGLQQIFVELSFSF